MARPTVTRAVLRRMIARQLGLEFFREYPEGYVTADAGATTTSLISSALTQDRKWWENCSLFISSGPLAGSERVITSFDSTKRECRWGPPLSGVPASGITFELFDHWTASLIHEAINRAIQEAAQWFPTEATSYQLLQPDKYVYSLTSLNIRTLHQLWVWYSPINLTTTVEAVTVAKKVILTSELGANLGVGDYISIYEGGGEELGTYHLITGYDSATREVTVATWDAVELAATAGSKVRVWSSTKQVQEIPLNYLRLDQAEYPNSLFLEKDYTQTTYAGFPLVMKYLAIPTTLTTEASTTDIPINYLLPKTLAILAMSASANTDFEHQRWMTLKQQYEEEALRFRLDQFVRAPAFTQQMTSLSITGNRSEDPMNWVSL